MNEFQVETVIQVITIDTALPEPPQLVNFDDEQQPNEAMDSKTPKD